MAGIEQLEIHSKVRHHRPLWPSCRAANVSLAAQSYIVRWVKVDEGHTISWSIQPHKKSM
jgi:hypothetical protein